MPKDTFVETFLIQLFFTGLLRLINYTKKENIFQHLKKLNMSFYVVLDVSIYLLFP